MNLLSATPRITIEEYLDGEQQSSIRHEFIDGQVYAMAGASANHNRVAGNLFASLSNHYMDGSCEPFISDMKVKVAEVFYYPDVMLCCDPDDHHRLYREQPQLLIEVTSAATERTDYYEKRLAYQRISTLRQYVIINPDKVLVDIFERDANGNWAKHTLSRLSDQLRLGSLNLPLLTVYRRVEFDLQ
jgi:Uma2 family endonuclease